MNWYRFSQNKLPAGTEIRHCGCGSDAGVTEDRKAEGCKIEAYVHGIFVGVMLYKKDTWGNLRWKDCAIEIKYINVNDDYKRNGIGSAMVKNMVDREGVNYSDIDWGDTTTDGGMFKEKFNELV